MSISTTAGFGAEPSKPDFAFPKTVSANAEKELKAAMKANQGPQTVRALIDWGLAQAKIDPDRYEDVNKKLESVQQEVKSPETKAMIALLRASVSEKPDSLLAVFNQFTPELKRMTVGDWRLVVNADAKFIPTMYDFGAVKLIEQSKYEESEIADSIRAAALEWNAGKTYPSFYLEYISAMTFNDYLELARKYFDSPVSEYALVAASQRTRDFPQRKEVYDLCLEWKKKHENSTEVDKVITFLTAPSVRYSIPAIVAKNKPMDVKVDANCLNSLTLVVRMIEPEKKEVARIPLKFEGSGMFQCDTTVQLSMKDYGKYTVRAEFPEMTRSKYPQTANFIVTDMIMSQLRYGAQSEIMALDAINGARQTDVRMETGPRGTHAVRGLDRYTPEIYTYKHSDPADVTINTANILTDRAVYHPGDKLKFVATVMSSRLMERKIESGKYVRAELYNVNHQLVDSIGGVTDEFGRIAGEFNLPSDGLTGRYALSILDMNSVSVLVTDYKAPTFEADVKSTRIDSTTVELSGTVMGYNGVPIADAQVAVNVFTLPDWVWLWNWHREEEEKVATDTVTTDSEGKYSVRLKVPDEVNLSANITATSPAGESHDASCFIASWLYFISVDIPDFVIAGKGPKFHLIDAQGETVDKPIDIVLKNDSVTIVPDKDWSNVPSGSWILEASAADAETLEEDGVIVYRPTDAMPPVTASLFCPVKSAAPGDELLVGTSYDDSHILYTLWTPERIIEQRWLTPEKGNFRIKIELPDSIDNATLTLFTLHDYKSKEQRINIVRPDVPRKLKVKISAMRDKVTPGDTEKWTINVVNNLGKPAPSAVILDIYSKALDAISPFSWYFNPPALDGKHFRININNLWRRFSTAAKTVFTPEGLGRIESAFNFYGEHWPSPDILLYSYRSRVSACLKSEAEMNMMTAGDMEEDAAVDESVVFEDKVADFTDAEAGAGGALDTDNSDLRVPELPVAMWNPVLTTDARGNLQVEFEVPNANTTWNVRTIAYNRELLSGTFSAEIISSKPVMIQPQLPRFLRVGDSIELRASVINNSDSTAEISSVVELFNPLSGKIIHSEKFAQTIEAAASAVISTRFTAPDVSLVGVRMRASAGNFSDGEQSLMPILPAEVKVMSAKPLFLPSDSASAVIDVPRGGVMTFTANAVWECVSALPGLIDAQSKSALSLSSAIFSAATARGLLRSYPAIGRAIAGWQNEDSALMANLDKNPDLKIALLSSTPFLNAARSEAEQKARLNLLFDRKLLDRTISGNIDDLQKLVKKGGFAWTGNCDEPSEWITMRVLVTVARLKRLGYLPESSSLKTMVESAVTYLDAQVGKNYSKYKTTNLLYVYVRSQFPEVRQSAPAKRAADATVQEVVGHWRDLSLSALPMAAIVLDENGYATTSRLLLESLRQREAWRQSILNPIMLEAFSKIEPESPEIEQIRNYYISRKHSMDWGEGPETSDLIAAILTSGADWLVPAENALSVKVNGVEASPSAVSALGEFRIDLPEGGNVEIAKGNFPAWGGVFASSTDSITSVKAFSSPELEMSRRIEGKFKVGEKIKIILTLKASQAMDYVVVTQPRCAAFEPVNQLPQTLWLFGLTAYREPCATRTNWFFNRLAKGETEISETFYVTANGTFALAPAEAQSQYAPEFDAHSEGIEIEVSE